jgi:hypothetical protein
MSALGAGVKSRRRQSFVNDRQNAFASVDVQFIHQASFEDTGFNLKALVLPTGAGSFQNPAPSTLAELNLVSNRNALELFNGAGKKLALGINYEIFGSQITFNDFTAEDNEIFFGTIRSVRVSGAEIVDGLTGVKTGFLTPGETSFNVGFDFPIESKERLSPLEVHRNRVIQYLNSDIEDPTALSDGDFSLVRAASTNSGTYIEFNDPGVTLPSGLPEFVSVSSRQFVVDRVTDTLRSEVEVLNGNTLRMADLVAGLAGIPASDIIGNDPSNVQIKQFGDILLGILDVQVPVVTAWVDFTPTGTWTTNVTYSGKRRQVGENVEIQYNVECSGAPDAVPLDFDFPPGITIDTSKLEVNSADGTVILLGNGSALDDGNDNFVLQPFLGSSGTEIRASLIDATVTYSRQTFVGATVPFVFAINDSVVLNVTFPAVGFEATQTLREHLEDKGIL